MTQDKLTERAERLVRQEVHMCLSSLEWFGRQLASQGERVDFDFAGMVVWGRTTTGQGIAMDSVVRTIAAELMKEIV